MKIALKIFLSYLILSVVVLSSNASTYKGLPQVDKDGRLPTLNKTGWIVAPTDPYSQEFINYSLQSKLPSLEIGAGYGHASFEVLKKGGSIYVNDLSSEHLDIFNNNIPAKFKNRLTLMPGKFQDLKIESNSLSAVLAVRVLHFLNGEELKAAAKQIYRWLAPGGKGFCSGRYSFSKTLGKISSCIFRK